MLRFAIIAVCIALSVADYDKKIGYRTYGNGLNNVYPYGGFLANQYNYGQLGYNSFPAQFGNRYPIGGSLTNLYNNGQWGYNSFPAQFGYTPYRRGYFPYASGYSYRLNNNYLGGYSPLGYENLGYSGLFGNNYPYNTYYSYSPYGLNNNNFLNYPSVGYLPTSVPQVLPVNKRRSIY